MPELTKEEKLKLVEKLPQRLSDFLYSEDTGAFLLYLGNKHKLPDEKVSALSKIVADIILKITPITNLAQEIVNKITPDQHMAMAIAQELNSELLALVLMPTPAAPPTSTAPAPVAVSKITPPTPPLSRGGEGGVVSPAPTPAPMPTPVMPPAPKPFLPAAPTIKTDQYREPMREAPEIIDLRKTPPPPLMQMPIAAAPAYIPEGISADKLIPPPTPKVGTPTPAERGVEAVPKPISPLTFTKSIEKPIEPPKPIPAPIPLIEADPHKISTPVPTAEPQYIIRPPGLAPTDLPHDVLDLRKDKGEF